MHMVYTAMVCYSSISYKFFGVSYDFPSANEAALKNNGKQIIWIH